ncbi:hypothetical protein [Borreliella valaisiana]|nr:hypothetical protein KJD09_06055 [Borreliella valaisiana]
MESSNVFTKKSALSNLKLNSIEHCVLDDMKRVISEFENNFLNLNDDVYLNSSVSIVENYNEKDFDIFF